MDCIHLSGQFSSSDILEVAKAKALGVLSLSIYETFSKMLLLSKASC